MSVEILKKYLPERAVHLCFDLIRKYNVHLKIVSSRRSRYGDYCKFNGVHRITINADQGKYAFLITLIHEMAHLVAYEQFGNYIKPHGREWKSVFKFLMVPFLNETIFPQKLLPIVKSYFADPKASSDTDTMLAVALRQYDEASQYVYLFSLLDGDRFRTKDGRVFIRGKKQIKRYLCQEEATGKWYVFQPHVQVEPI